MGRADIEKKLEEIWGPLTKHGYLRDVFSSEIFTYMLGIKCPYSYFDENGVEIFELYFKQITDTTPQSEVTIDFTFPFLVPIMYFKESELEETLERVVTTVENQFKKLKFPVVHTVLLENFDPVKLIFSPEIEKSQRESFIQVMHEEIEKKLNTR